MNKPQVLNAMSSAEMAIGAHTLPYVHGSGRSPDLGAPTNALQATLMPYGTTGHSGRRRCCRQSWAWWRLPIRIRITLC